MRSYKDKSELIEAIQTSLQKYLLEFEGIDESMKDQRLIAEDKTPSEHLSYQLGWVRRAGGKNCTNAGGRVQMESSWCVI